MWSNDFMHDSLPDGNRFKSFVSLDDFRRKGPDIAVDFTPFAGLVISALGQIIGVAEKAISHLTR